MAKQPLGSIKIDLKDLALDMSKIEDDMLKAITAQLKKTTEDMLFSGMWLGSSTPSPLPYVVTVPRGITSSKPAKEPPMKIETYELEGHQSVRVSVDLSLRQLRSEVAGRHLLENTMDMLATQLSNEAMVRLMSMGQDLDKMIRDEMRVQIREQVKQAIADRIDDFVEETLGE